MENIKHSRMKECLYKLATKSNHRDRELITEEVQATKNIAPPPRLRAFTDVTTIVAKIEKLVIGNKQNIL